MAVNFIKKFHTCTSCGKKDYELFAIKSNSDLNSGYPSNCKPEDLKDNGIYVEEIHRDNYGIVLSRVAKEKKCSVCLTYTLEADKVDNETNVLNFFPRTEAHKWLDGMGKAGL
jgi:hypothetical protein